MLNINNTVPNYKRQIGISILLLELDINNYVFETKNLSVFFFVGYKQFRSEPENVIKTFRQIRRSFTFSERLGLKLLLF